MSSILKGKKVLVTGGAGFIGSHIVDGLIALGANVVVLDNLVTGDLANISHNFDKIKFIKKDIRDDEALEEALEGVEYVSHQAALRSVPKSVEIPFDYHDVNVTGTLKLFLKARDKGIKRIAFASSSSVYGDRTDFPEIETDLPQPISPYAATKLMGEHYAYIFKVLYNFEIVSLRYFNVFGPRQSLENQYAVVVPKFINCLLGGESAPIYGDGNQERDFTYIENVVEANICALTKKGIGGEIYNVACGEPQSVNNLLKELQGILGKDIAPTYLELRVGDVAKTCADMNKLEELLGHSLKVKFNQGLEKTSKWFSDKYKGK